jgi:hypothetical protein
MSNIASNIAYIIIILIVLVYLSFTAYLKYKLKFWLTQPVFHIYNLWYWMHPPGIISRDLPSITSITQKGAANYLNQYNIKTINVEGIEDTILCDQICNFIKTNYIFQSKQAVYTPTKSNILEYHKGANHPSFFSIYQQPKILFEKGEATTTIKELIAVISARPLNITLKNTPTFPTYYIDNLCVEPVHRKSGFAPQIIQTQCYNLRHANKKIQTCLFKREGELNALVPLTVFETICFDLTACNINIKKEGSEHYSLIEIGIPQLSLFMDFIKSQIPFFECVVLPDITNLTNLIKTENLFIYALLNPQGQISASYIFRNLNLSYDNGKKAIECINIVLKKEEDENKQYELGFNIALFSLKKKKAFDYLLIEETANAKVIVDHLINNIKASIKFKSPTAFFLYNYAQRSISNSALALMIY